MYLRASTTVVVLPLPATALMTVWPVPLATFSNTAVWYLLDCRYANMRPFFWQEREAPQLVQLVDPANPAVFFQDKYYMGARSRGAASNALWFKAIRCSA